MLPIIHVFSNTVHHVSRSLGFAVDLKVEAYIRKYLIHSCYSLNISAALNFF